MAMKRFTLLAMLLIAALIMTACPQAAPEAPAEQPPAAATPAPAPEATPAAEEEPTAEEPAAPTTDRRGAWVDEVIVVEEPSDAAAVTRLNVGEIDIYAKTVTDAELFQTVQNSPDLAYAQSFGSYGELTFNPAGPVFEGTGNLNPFAVPRAREAMNYLIDRTYIAQEIFGGLAVPKFFPITAAFPDYANLIDVARALELQYAHNPERAAEMIAEEMEALGAEQVNGQWQYEGEPVEIIVLIRTEDQRRDVGDYVSNLLEDLGFAVTRDYKTAAEASPIWLRGNPSDGLFHIYTGGWITTTVDRDQADNFEFFYTPRGLAVPLNQAFTPSEEFDDLSERLAQSDFTTLEERRELFARALELAMQDSQRVWVQDSLAFSPYRAEIAVTADLAGAISGSWLWALTLRKGDQEGGTVTIALPSILTDPWNPLDGSNWIFDTMLYRGTSDLGTISDPFTGLSWPQRIERAEVTIKEGLPVGVTHDWVELSFAETIEVPEDAWIDWDVAGQQWITIGEQHPEGLTANRKSVVYYPADLYDTVRWHDGSNFSIADVILSMILPFERGNEESEIYDEATAPAFQSFLETFRGYRIVDEDPLTIEFYSDFYALDAELNVAAFFPHYLRGPGSWHAVAMGIRAEASEELAFSSAKATALETEWMSFIAGPSLAVLERHLNEAAGENYIPYAATLGQYISEEEAATRWTNLQSWYGDKRHFWVGMGPLYVEAAFPVEGTVQLRRFEDYPDPADKWQRFESPMIAEVEIEGPGRVTIGQEAVFEVFVDFQGEPYAVDQINQVTYLIFDATGDLVFTGQAEAVDDGLWEVVLSAEQTGELAAGANRLEIAVAPIPVSIPTFGSLEFVTVP
jgi:peptide/nickel transport system substrate-binding protein